MTSRRAALVLACVAVSGGALGACGGDTTYIDSVPKSTPDLTVPSNGAGLPAAQTTSTTSTTATTTTPTTTTGTSTSSGSGTITPSTTTPSQSTGGTSPSTGTTTQTQTSTSNSGGTPAGGFSDFCKQNPGACGQ
jgi:hypothetical protein